MVASFSAGAAIGPLAGGLLLEFFWWGSVFLVAVPVMVLLLVLGPCCCPSSAIPTPAGGPDERHSVAGCHAGGDLRSKQIAQDGLGWLPALSILAGFALGVIFFADNEVWPTR